MFLPITVDEGRNMALHIKLRIILEYKYGHFPFSGKCYCDHSVHTQRRLLIFFDKTLLFRHLFILSIVSLFTLPQ